MAHNMGGACRPPTGRQAPCRQLSLSPLWISWAENEGVEGRVGVLYLSRELAAPLPGGRPPAANW